MYLTFHAPHDPQQAPQKYRERYPSEKIQLLPSFIPVHAFDIGDMVVRDEALATWSRSPEIAKQELADDESGTGSEFDFWDHY